MRIPRTVIALFVWTFCLKAQSTCNGVASCSGVSSCNGTFDSCNGVLNLSQPPTCAGTSVCTGSSVCTGTLNSCASMPAVLGISSTHTGSFAFGQKGAEYALIVSSLAAGGPTTGTVTVTETAPAGLSLVSMSGGTTWNCTVLPYCTTNTVLNAGSIYPMILVTANVAANAPASVTNEVSVSGGGSPTTTVTDSTYVILPGPSTVYLTTVPTITGGCYWCGRDPVQDFGAYLGYVGGAFGDVSFSNWVCDTFQWDGSYQPNISLPGGGTNYTLTSFAGPGTDLSSTMADGTPSSGGFGVPGDPQYNIALLEYEEATLLLGGDGTSALPGFINIDHTNGTLVTAYQFAIYNVFTSTSTMAYWGNGLDPTVGGAATALLVQAQNDAASSTDFSSTYSKLRIYTPTNQSLCDQEFYYWCGNNAEFLQFPPGSCDVNQDGSIDVSDVQLTINEALGESPAVNDQNGDGVVNVVDTQIDTNAVLGLGCSATTAGGSSLVVRN